ncbi:unnamed protein product [Cylindrotheca closterium]|uniref:Leucine-rich repeat-containing N-terminal plant-type domain-containing protein n=1 Tax=Cylindrotheca closterium TaxID=2856 RepID=A0AAD2JIZ5_9STRA|nr:unnamed protein product [Cylindrotheca closterium]
MTKSDTDSDNTDLESPSTEDSTKGSKENPTKKSSWRLPVTQRTLHILFFGTLVGLLVCLGIGLYSLKRLEDAKVVEDESPEAPPKATKGDDDDLAFDIRPPSYSIKTDVPTVAPSETRVDNASPPPSVNVKGENLLQELRSIFGQEIAIKIQNRNSPLNKSYTWIIDQDEYVKTNPNAATVQRFMLAAFYYATGGRRARSTWNLCSAVPVRTSRGDENRDTSLPIRCVFEEGESVCAFLDEFRECPEYYQDWEMPPTAPKKRWLSNSFECDWYGISCNDDGEVYQIALPNNGLEGSLIPEMTALEKLTHINLDYNSIGGPMPSLNKMDIHELSLAWNSIVGRLELSDQWPNLERLVLGDGNNLNISISPRFGLNEKLGNLDLSGNNIDSGLPGDQAAYNWGVLTDLRLANCNLGGSLPDGLSGLSNLVSLDVQQNRLTGNLPSLLWKFANLQSLRLEYNYFHGTLSSEIGNLINLRKLSIVDIGLTGTLPSEFSKLQKLESVSLQHNAFRSPVPAAMCSTQIMPELHTLEADCGWRGFGCTCCTLCCEAIVFDPNKCHSQ